MNTYAVHRGAKILAVFYSARTPDDPTIQAEMEQEAANAQATWTAARGIQDPATFVNPADSTSWPEGATYDDGLSCNGCGGPLPDGTVEGRDPCPECGGKWSHSAKLNEWPLSAEFVNPADWHERPAGATYDEGLFCGECGEAFADGSRPGGTPCPGCGVPL